MARQRILSFEYKLSDCISQANACEQRAYFWENKKSDLRYLNRFGFTPDDAERQFLYAAEGALTWYARAQKCKR